MIDCSNISTTINQKENPFLYFHVHFTKSLYCFPAVAGYYDHYNKKIFLQSKIKKNIEQLTVNLLSHESLHHIIGEYVGETESNLPDVFLEKLHKHDPRKIDASGMLLKNHVLYGIKKRMRLI